MTKVKKRPGPAPKTLTEGQIKEIEKLAANFNIKQMADYFGISKDTFFRIKQDVPEVDRLYRKGRAAAIDRMANVITKAAEDGNITAAMFYLKTQAGWRERSDIEIEDDEVDSRPQQLLVRFVSKEDLKEVKDLKDGDNR